MGKTYGQVWASTPCLKRHASKQGNWVARMRLIVLLSYVKQHRTRGVLPPDSEALYEEMVTLGKLTFPEMKALEVHRRARELTFEF